jgi:hypothetical protein
MLPKSRMDDTQGRNQITCDSHHSRVGLGPIHPNRGYIHLSYIPQGFHRLTNEFKLNLSVSWVYSSVLTDEYFVVSCSVRPAASQSHRQRMQHCPLWIQDRDRRQADCLRLGLSCLEILATCMPGLDVPHRGSGNIVPGWCNPRIWFGGRQLKP